MVGTLRFAHPTRSASRETLSFGKCSYQTSSDTSPAGSSNSNVFSVIDTSV
jgi:hypothetical protein